MLGVVIMAYISPQIIPSDWVPSFSGHETFVLRGSWLKKAYDLVLNTPSLFSHEDAFVMLGVGKNMAQSIRHWGKVCNIFERCANGTGFQPTQLGHALFADDGWDPFLVTPTSAWLLHWQIAARPEGAATWFYTFNLFRSGEWTAEQLCDHLDTWCAEHDWRRPSATTLRRDVECMLQSYSRPTMKQVGAAEDGLLCPLSELNLVQSLGNRYWLSSNDQSTLTDELVAFAIHEWLRRYGRRTVSFGELAYSPCSPGRVFRLDEDALLQRLQRIEQTTAGAAYFTDQAGIRQVAWQGSLNPMVGFELLGLAFANEVNHV